LAKVYEDWGSVRDVFHLDIEQNVDPLAPLVFSILLDREKNRDPPPKHATVHIR
jgi:hypothetical protein